MMNDTMSLQTIYVIPPSRFERVLYGLAITVLPVLAFWGTYVLGPDWQSGEFSDYIALLLKPQSAILFIGLISYSAISLLLLLIRPAYFSEKLLIRFGLYTGVLLTFQYVILATMMMGFSPISGIGLVCFYWLTKKVGARLGFWRTLGAFVIFILGLSLILMAVIKGSFESFLIFPLAILASGAPVVCFTIATTIARQLLRNYDIPFAITSFRISCFVTWLMGYTAAWVYSVYQMFELYNALPKEPPCYVVTAAAQGHPRFVGSQPVSTSSGIIWVNRQLQTLKCAELALQALAPRLHRLLRFIYDIVGPVLARRLTHPLLADIAYLSLKPAELLARFALRCIVPNLDEYASHLYR